MATVVNSPFRSKYGFESTGFIVDDEGNISAKSITVVQGAIDPSLPADQIFEEVGGNFRIAGDATDNPEFTVFRNNTITIDLDLNNLDFNIFVDNNFDTFYSEGLIHSSGDTGVAAQGKRTGRLAWTPPLSTPSTLYYADTSGSVSGTITVQNTPNAFSEVSITGTTASTSTTTGALIVAGGVGVQGDLYIGGELNLGGIGIPKLSSSTNLDLNATNKIVLQIENITLGYIDENGLSIPINNSSIIESTIDSTIIGSTVPTSATFTSAGIENAPVNNTDATNKSYVDTTVTALAIALGS